MKVKRKAVVLLAFMFVLAFMAQEVASQAVSVKNVRTANNFIVLFDSSSSMKKNLLGTGGTKYEMAKKILRKEILALPKLGYKAGLYSFSPFNEIYPMRIFNRDEFNWSINYLPKKPGGITHLSKALREIKPVLKTLKGRTVIFIITNGYYTQFEGFKGPVTVAKEISKEYDVCFNVVSVANTKYTSEFSKDIAEVNKCSRLISAKGLSENTESFHASLYKTKNIAAVKTYVKPAFISSYISRLKASSLFSPNSIPPPSGL